MTTTIDEIPQILKGLSSQNKYYIYLLLLDRRIMSISEIQKELERKFNVRITYSSVQSLLDSMYRAGIIKYIDERPRKVKLLKKIDFIIQNL